MWRTIKRSLMYAVKYWHVAWYHMVRATVWVVIAAWATSHHHYYVLALCYIMVATHMALGLMRNIEYQRCVDRLAQIKHPMQMELTPYYSIMTLVSGAMPLQFQVTTLLRSMASSKGRFRVCTLALYDHGPRKGLTPAVYLSKQEIERVQQRLPSIKAIFTIAKP